MADIIEWPRVLEPAEVGLDFTWNSRDGGAGINGVTQIVSPLSGLWGMSIVLHLGNEGRNRSFAALKMEAKGRYGWIRFPIFDPYRVRFLDANWPVPIIGGVPFSDGVFFSDGSGFAYPDITTTLAVGGTLGDETATFEVDSLNDALGTGHLFSINDYLHRVTRPVGTKSGSNRVFSFGPPLRADFAAGTEVKIGRPTFLCRFATDNAGAIKLAFGRFGEPSVEFVEVLGRE